MPIFEGGIIGELKKRKQQRDVETFKDSFIAKMSEAGANDDAIEIMSKIKAESPEKLVSAFNSISESITKNTLSGQKEAMALKVQQSLATESFKAKMSFIPELTKSMAASGNYTPEQIQEFAGLAAEKAQYGIEDRINKAKQDPATGKPEPTKDLSGEESPSTANDLFSQKLPPKMSSKQRDFKDTMDRGLQILDEVESQYNIISEKYGTGRLKGLTTTLAGKMGDLLPMVGGKEAPEVVPYMNNLDGLANFIGKTVYRDERVSDVNIKGYKKALAELTNTPEEAKIMFATLRSYATGRSVKDEIALRYMVPKEGKALKPSEAIKASNGDFSKLSIEQKRAIVAQNRKKK